MSENHFFANLRRVITLVDNLRDIGLQNYISLPRIVVLGTQSAGKSSLLEQIVGLDFLPRGSGVVTRRPLELRLVYKPPTEIQAPYAVFDELKGQVFQDFDKVRQAIEKLTDDVAGDSKNIVDKPIILHVYSSTCPDLTLVDLPGITRIALQGQDANIEKVTTEMAKRYIDDPQTIILAVIPANADITTSDSLMLAKKADQKGERTLGVITKIDIMDRGVDAKGMILGKEVPLKLGYVGIVGRSQQDIKDKKPVKSHLVDEQKYFSTHPVYSTLPSGTLGTDSLTNRLTEILYKHIRKSMPDLIKQITTLIKKRQTRLDELGPGLPDTDQEKLKYLWTTVTQFSILFKTSLQGTYSKNNLLKNETPAGSEIRMILQELYKENSEKPCCAGYTDKDINLAITLHEAGAIPGFPSMDSFLALLIPKIKAMKEPAQEMITDVYSILERLAKLILSKLCERVPEIKVILEDKILEKLQQERERTRDIINDLLESEVNYVYTQDLQTILERKQKSALNLTEKQQQDYMMNPIVYELRQKIDDYYSIVVRGLRDTIPKMIGNFLVNGSQQQMKNVLFDITSRSRELYEQLKEPIHIMEERRELKQSINTMQSAIDIIRKDPEMSQLLNRQIEDAEEDENEFDHKRKMREEDEKKRKEMNKKLEAMENKMNQDEEDEMRGVVKKTASKNLNAQPPQNQPQTQAPANKQQSMFGNTAVKTSSNSSTASNTTTGTQNSNQSAVNSMFGTKQQPTQATNTMEKKPNPPTQQSQQQQMFGQQGAQQQKAPAQQQASTNNTGAGQPVDKTKAASALFGTAAVEKKIDQGVDKVVGNPQVQKAAGQVANQAVTNLVDSQIPIKNADGKNPIAEQAGKMAEKATQDPKVQQQAAQGAKDALKNQIQDDKKDEKKDKGGFKFW